MNDDLCDHVEVKRHVTCIQLITPNKVDDSPALCFSAATILSCPRTIVIPRERNAESYGLWIGPGGGGWDEKLL